MHRGLPCQSAGLATSGSGSTTASACGSPACGSWIGSAISLYATSVSASIRLKYAKHETQVMMQRNTMQNSQKAAWTKFTNSRYN